MESNISGYLGWHYERHNERNVTALTGTSAMNVTPCMAAAEPPNAPQRSKSANLNAKQAIIVKHIPMVRHYIFQESLQKSLQ